MTDEEFALKLRKSTAHELVEMLRKEWDSVNDNPAMARESIEHCLLSAGNFIENFKFFDAKIELTYNQKINKFLPRVVWCPSQEEDEWCLVAASYIPAKHEKEVK